MIACIASAILHGVEGRPVAVEVHVNDRALPGFTIVGLPDAAVRESRDRVRAALVTSGYDWPNRKMTVNLAPATIRFVMSYRLEDARWGSGLRSKARRAASDV